jgi:hypothetical protein
MTASYAQSTAAEQSPFESARRYALATELTLVGEEMLHASHAELEQFVQERGREWARQLLEALFALRAANERRVDVVGADGVTRMQVRGRERHLETVVGRVTVPRQSYGVPGATTLHPMDSALNLPQELYSHGVRRLVAKAAARSSFDEVVELVREHTGAKVPKRQVEELAARAARDAVAFYEQRASELAADDELIVISTDGKGIAMRHEDLREGTRKAAEHSERKLETRLTPGEKRNRKRMTQVATVYNVAPWQRGPADVLHGLRGEEAEAARPRPRDKRVWASVEKEPRAVIREALQEALKRDPNQQRRWVVLVDGACNQLRLVKQEVRRAKVTVTIVIDFIHVIEYVWKAARALFGGSNEQAEKWVSDRLLALLSGRTGGDVARRIRWWAQQRADKLDQAARSALDQACRYLADRTRTRLMRYADALAGGLPIATGVVEGACRYLVKDRMDRTGARWSLAGAEAVLTLRSLCASGHFDEYWDFHLEQERQRNHVVRYAGGKLPDPLPVGKAHLRLVK